MRTDHRPNIMLVEILTILSLIFLMGLFTTTPLGNRMKALQYFVVAIAVLFLVLMFFTPMGWKI